MQTCISYQMHAHKHSVQSCNNCLSPAQLCVPPLSQHVVTLLSYQLNYATKHRGPKRTSVSRAQGFPSHNISAVHLNCDNFQTGIKGNGDKKLSVCKACSSSEPGDITRGVPINKILFSLVTRASLHLHAVSHYRHKQMLLENTKCLNLASCLFLLDSSVSLRWC